MNTAVTPFYKGKVRDLFDAGEGKMILVATDRISAFDVVFGDEIPGKGKILTSVSNSWFQAIRKSDLQSKLDFTDHLLETSIDRFPDGLRSPDWNGRAVLVKKTRRVDFECVVRGYLAGSAFKEYQQNGTACGIKMPSGLQQASKLDQPIFTPATKAETGHDENVSFEYMRNQLGELAERLRDISIGIYNFAAERMKNVGILLCDTKFEFGILEDRILLIDEALTPDSSRYWDADTYQPGISPTGFDKQFIRDYVESIGWSKVAPAPALPPEVIQQTIRTYGEIQKRIDRANA